MSLTTIPLVDATDEELSTIIREGFGTLAREDLQIELKFAQLDEERFTYLSGQVCDLRDLVHGAADLALARMRLANLQDPYLLMLWKNAGRELFEAWRLRELVNHALNVAEDIDGKVHSVGPVDTDELARVMEAAEHGEF